jgi:serine/threonine protein kinase
VHDHDVRWLWHVLRRGPGLRWSGGGADDELAKWGKPLTDLAVRRGRNRCGTPGYVAPEILKAGVNEGYGDNVDIFSVS